VEGRRQAVTWPVMTGSDGGDGTYLYVLLRAQYLAFPGEAISDLLWV
jgi:hypothetical protein